MPSCTSGEHRPRDDQPGRRGDHSENFNQVYSLYNGMNVFHFIGGVVITVLLEGNRFNSESAGNHP